MFIITVWLLITLTHALPLGPRWIARDNRHECVIDGEIDSHGASKYTLKSRLVTDTWIVGITREDRETPISRSEQVMKLSIVLNKSHPRSCHQLAHDLGLLVAHSPSVRLILTDGRYDMVNRLAGSSENIDRDIHDDVCDEPEFVTDGSISVDQDPNATTVYCSRRNFDLSYSLRSNEEFCMNDIDFHQLGQLCELLLGFRLAILE